VARRDAGAIIRIARVRVRAVPDSDDHAMFEEPMSTAELLEQWREAIRASELAARLAKIAADSVERTAKDATASEELARLAERAAAAANQAADTARKAANLAAELSRQSVVDQTRDDKTLADAQDDENFARDRYHKAESDARARHPAEPA
jgi:hypothetical protein